VILLSSVGKKSFALRSYASLDGQQTKFLGGGIQKTEKKIDERIKI